MAAMPGMPFPMGGQPMQQQQQQQQQITPQQMQAIQQKFLQDAQAQGLTPQQYAAKLQAMARQQQQAMMQQQQGGQQTQEGGQGGEQGQQQQQQPQQGVPQPVQQRIDSSQPPKPEALALATFLRSQNLKSRPCILQEQRRELFKVKRAIRAIQSPAYEKARRKNPLLPEVTDRASAENTFKMLPISMLALRVTKVDPGDNPAHGEPGHTHGSSKKQKSAKKGGVWTVRIEPQQDAQDQMHYVWFYQGSQWKQKLYAIGALIAVVAVVLFPLWPYFLRKGVWYLSMACLGLLGAFFGLAIVRLIIFVLTIVVGPKPGIWIYPNLFEDVGFFDSFRPMWAWREIVRVVLTPKQLQTPESLATKKAERRAKKQARLDKRSAKTNGGPGTNTTTTTTTTKKQQQQQQQQQKQEGQGDAAVATAAAAAAASVEESTSTSVEKVADGGQAQLTARRNLNAQVEEADDE